MSANSDDSWFVYLMRCSDGSFYTGVTTDLERRVRQHNGEIVGGANYTRARRPVALAWYEACEDRSVAQQREYSVRRLSRREKQDLAARVAEKKMLKGDETLGSDLLEDFWRWAVAHYEDVQVREGLLELQESSDLIILEAMFLTWLGHRGQVIGEEDQQRIRAVITPWVEGVVLPLRRQRQAWTDMPSMITNRRRLLGLELEAERVLAQLLIDALPMGEQLNDLAPPAVDQNLSQLPELKDVVTRRRVVKIFGL